VAYSDPVARPGRLQIRTDQSGTTHFLILSGELDLSCCDAVEEELTRIESNGAEQIVLDLDAVDFIDSNGIALLVAALRRDQGGRRVRFIPSRSEDVQRLLELCGLKRHFPFIDA
jgi:anti-sigma B factor antagonist